MSGYTPDGADTLDGVFGLTDASSVRKLLDLSDEPDSPDRLDTDPVRVEIDGIHYGLTSVLWRINALTRPQRDRIRDYTNSFVLHNHKDPTVSGGWLVDEARKLV